MKNKYYDIDKVFSGEPIYHFITMNKGYGRKYVLRKKGDKDESIFDS